MARRRRVGGCPTDRITPPAARQPPQGAYRGRYFATSRQNGFASRRGGGRGGRFKTPEKHPSAAFSGTVVNRPPILGTPLLSRRGSAWFCVFRRFSRALKKPKPKIRHRLLVGQPRLAAPCSFDLVKHLREGFIDDGSHGLADEAVALLGGQDHDLHHMLQTGLRLTTIRFTSRQVATRPGGLDRYRLGRAAFSAGTRPARSAIALRGSHRGSPRTGRKG